MNQLDQAIDTFLAAPSFAVVGASDDPQKYGYKCYACYLQHSLKAFAINPRATTILGNPVFPNLFALPEKVQSISVITPPAVTEKIVEEAITYGVKNIWLQPGAENETSVDKARKAGLNVIFGGPCLLVTLGYRQHNGT